MSIRHAASQIAVSFLLIICCSHIAVAHDFVITPEKLKGVPVRAFPDQKSPCKIAKAVVDSSSRISTFVLKCRRSFPTPITNRLTVSARDIELYFSRGVIKGKFSKAYLARMDKNHKKFVHS